MPKETLSITIKKCWWFDGAMRLIGVPVLEVLAGCIIWKFAYIEAPGARIRVYVHENCDLIIQVLKWSLKFEAHP